MKFFTVAVFVVAIAFLLQFVAAIPNPAPVYCTEMGYAIDGDYCVFDSNGTKCEQWAFYRGECGAEFVKQLPCAASGEQLVPGHECCSGLTSINPLSAVRESGGLCEIAVGGWPVCAPCGNGACDASYENSCNCPDDCKITTCDLYCPQGFETDANGGTLCKCKPCICPLVYSPVCGVNGVTYSNSCIARCEGVDIAYSGECASETIKAEVGKEFDLKEKQTVTMIENNEKIGIEITLGKIGPKTKYSCIEGVGCYQPHFVLLDVTNNNGGTSIGTTVSLKEGESTTVFGVTINNLEISTNSARFLVTKETTPEVLTVQLGENFAILQDQTAKVLKGSGDVMKISFEGLIEAKCAAPAYRASGNTEEIIKCEAVRYAQFRASLADGGTEYLSLREGQGRKLGNYKISFLSLGIPIEGGKYLAKMVVNEATEPGTIIVNLGKPFNLAISQKAIVEETRLQLKLSEISGDVAVLDVSMPIWIQAENSTAITTRALSENDKNAIETEVSQAVGSGAAPYRPHLKIRVGETQEIYGHSITLNGIAAPNCVVGANCIGASELANLTVSKATEPGVKKVMLNEKFDLVRDQTAAVYDGSSEAALLKMKLVEISMATCTKPITEKENEKYYCDTRPVATVSVSLPGGGCSAEGACTYPGIAFSIREGEERAVEGLSVRLIEISGNSAWFVVKKQLGVFIKVKLDEEFKLKETQTAFVVGEELFVRLDSSTLISKCKVDDAKCMEGRYAVVSVWKNTVYKEGKKELQPIPGYTIKIGDTLNLYGVGITLLDLGAESAKFVVRKSGSGIINVHIDEPFKLQESQAARVLEANMRIDLLGIISPTCDTNELSASNNTACAGSVAEISVSNYIFSTETTGKALKKSDYIEEIVQSSYMNAEWTCQDGTTKKNNDTNICKSAARWSKEAEEFCANKCGTTDLRKCGTNYYSAGVPCSTTEPAPAIPVPPTPFQTFRLQAGESVEVNDFVIKLSGIGYSSAEFVVTKKGSGDKIKIELYNGWNLFSIPGKLNSVSSDCETKDFKIFEYDKAGNKFVPVTSETIGKALWLYNPGKSCKAEGVLGEATTMANIDEMTPGWNFAPITKDMLGSKIRELAKGCEPKAAYFYNANSRKWENAADRTLSESDLGKGFALYAKNACRLGGITEPPLPPIPSLPTE